MVMIAFVWSAQLLYLSSIVLGNPLFSTLLEKRARFDLNKTPSPEHSNEIKDVEDNVNHFILALPAPTLEEKSGLIITTKSGRKKYTIDRNTRKRIDYRRKKLIEDSILKSEGQSKEKEELIARRKDRNVGKNVSNRIYRAKLIELWETGRATDQQRKTLLRLTQSKKYARYPEEFDYYQNKRKKLNLDARTKYQQQKKKDSP